MGAHRSVFRPVCRSFPGARVSLRVVVCVWRGCVFPGMVVSVPAWLESGVAGAHGPAPQGDMDRPSPGLEFRLHQRYRMTTTDARQSRIFYFLLFPLSHHNLSPGIRK